MWKLWAHANWEGKCLLSRKLNVSWSDTTLHAIFTKLQLLPKHNLKLNKLSRIMSMIKCKLQTQNFEFAKAKFRVCKLETLSFETRNFELRNFKLRQSRFWVWNLVLNFEFRNANILLNSNFQVSAHKISSLQTLKNMGLLNSKCRLSELKISTF